MVFCVELLFTWIWTVWCVLLWWLTLVFGIVLLVLFDGLVLLVSSWTQTIVLICDYLVVLVCYCEIWSWGCCCGLLLLLFGLVVCLLFGCLVWMLGFGFGSFLVVGWVRFVWLFDVIILVLLLIVEFLYLDWFLFINLICRFTVAVF